MSEWVSGALSGLNRAAPWAKSLIPYPIYRWLMRSFFSSAKEFDSRPHRKWILEKVMPTLAAGAPERVVFVGCAPYTFYYEQAFSGMPTDYVTIDPLAKARVWGSDHHIVDFVENIGKYLLPQSVDSLVLVGVYGFGPKTDDDLHMVLEAIHKVLKRGGLLVFSWNNDLSTDPIEHRDFKRLYRHQDALGMPARKTFETSLVLDLHVAA